MGSESRRGLGGPRIACSRGWATRKTRSLPLERPPSSRLARDKGKSAALVPGGGFWTQPLEEHGLTRLAPNRESPDERYLDLLCEVGAIGQRQVSDRQMRRDLVVLVPV